MKKQTAIVFMLSMQALSFGSAFAAPVCNDISNYIPSSASLIPVSCGNETSYKVLDTLTKSGQFPDVSFLDICYASDPNMPISMTIGNLPVTIKSISNWTNNFDTFGTPFILGGTGTIATVVSQLSFANRNGRSIGKVYTKDSINFATLLTSPPTPTPEDLNIIGGTSLLTNTRGTIKISSFLNPATGIVSIISITGKICTTE